MSSKAEALLRASDEAFRIWNKIRKDLERSGGGSEALRARLQAAARVETFLRAAGNALREGVEVSAVLEEFFLEAVETRLEPGDELIELIARGFQVLAARTE